MKRARKEKQFMENEFGELRRQTAVKYEGDIIRDDIEEDKANPLRQTTEIIKAAARRSLKPEEQKALMSVQKAFALVREKIAAKKKSKEAKERKKQELIEM